MPDTPTDNKEPAGLDAKGMSRRSRLLILGAILLVIVAVIVVVSLVLGSGGETSTINGSNGTGDVTDVTSPYDLHELPTGSGPGDVKNASLISILLVAADGTSSSYGVSSDTDPAKAILKAVADAKEVDAAGVSTSETAAASTGTEALMSTLTFLFPDRTTLSFDLYVDQGIVARDGHFWRVEGDLAALIEAAVTYRQQR